MGLEPHVLEPEILSLLRMPIPPRGLNTESTLVSYLVVPNLENIKTIELFKRLVVLRLQHARVQI